MKHSINILMLAGAITCATCLPVAQVQATMGQAGMQETDTEQARTQALHVLHELDAFFPNFEKAVEGAAQGKANATTVAANYQNFAPSQLPIELRVQKMFDKTIESQKNFIDKMMECLNDIMPEPNDPAITKILNERELMITSLGKSYTEVECWKIKADRENHLLESNIRQGVTFSEEIRVPLLYVEASMDHIINLSKAVKEVYECKGKRLNKKTYEEIHILARNLLSDLLEVQSVLE